jgi:hypothetical protein
MNTLIAKILEKLEELSTEEIGKKEIYKSDLQKHGNEFLFILKPEVFCNTTTNQIKHILEIVFERFKNYKLQIDNILVFSGEYLNTNNIIANHYGIINALAKNVKANISNEALANFEKIYDQEFAKNNVYGAIELLNSELDINNITLAELWNSNSIERLAGGIYSVKANFNGKDLYIINGFHPPQLNHFIEDGRIIITMNLSGSVNWKDARQKMIGNTYPEKAEKGSIRRDLFDWFGNYGFENASYVINSVHLSAGPLEGLIELMRFNLSNTPKEYLFGQSLADNFSQTLVEFILTNPVVRFNQSEISLFDLTEDLSADEAIKLLRQVDWKNQQ